VGGCGWVYACVCRGFVCACRSHTPLCPLPETSVDVTVDSDDVITDIDDVTADSGCWPPTKISDCTNPTPVQRVKDLISCFFATQI